MVEIRTPQREIERIEQEFRPVGAKLTRKTKANSFIGYLTAWKNTFTRLKNTEMVVLMDEIINKFNEFYPKRLTKMEIIQGWKNYGEAHPEIWKGFDNDFRIKVWHNAGFEVKEVRKEALNRILVEIKQLKPQETISCYEMAFRMGYGENPKLAWKKLWGERMNEYFPNFYFPCLILRELGIIGHDRKGNITRKI